MTVAPVRYEADATALTHLTQGNTPNIYLRVMLEAGVHCRSDRGLRESQGDSGVGGSGGSSDRVPSVIGPSRFNSFSGGVAFITIGSGAFGCAGGGVEDLVPDSAIS